ncbi:FYN-binding protein 1 [Melanotaenia boesemani]|uniref:FYN-binding protein 1 n=1 Tax=Melanotaenia boesemani TaxID=1250792 RepID=UPI001C04B6BA|nr:FYN-binding protein 1 [Melanotaenia boesemani]
MEESVDVKALRARFNNKTSTSDTSSRDSGSPKSPRPGFGRAILSPTESELANRQSPVVPPVGLGQSLMRFPRAEPSFIPSRPASFPRPPPISAVRPPIEPADTNKVKQTGEMLQNMMLRHQRPPGTRLTPPLAPVVAQGLGASPSSTALPLRQQPRQKNSGDVIPLRRPLPPEGPQPLKPKRPPNVSLEPFRKSRQKGALPAEKKSDEGTSSMSGSAGRTSSPAVISPPVLPQRPTRPYRLPRQIASVDFEEEQDVYDDIGSFDKNESCSENSSQCMDGDDDDDVYEHIDENQIDVKHVAVEKKTKAEEKRQLENERREKQELQKKQNELKKNFQLQGEVDVLHTAKVRHDWHGGGKLDLSVRQGESVEIIRVKNNPGGKWLARSMNGKYGYISNTCVDIDYEAIKSRMLPPRKINSSELPPPPPDPPQLSYMESNNRDSMLQDDDDYDDVEPIAEDFPPPPPEISMDPKKEKELRKKFKYEGPLRVLHCMMVDPNCIIKKLGSKDLPVTKGEIVDVIQLNSSKKALCRNKSGKYGYVSKDFLLPMEGDVYDDVDYAGDIYDNDSPHTDY